MDVENDGVNSDILANEIYQTAFRLRCAYVHISKALDNDGDRTPEALFAKKFSLNSTIPKLRILFTANLIDNIASCGMREKEVSRIKPV
jgi:hypothetical protein